MENKILHVEDNPDDVMLMNLAFNRAGIAARLHVVNDGDEAIAALEAGATNGGPPVCVLLDVKLPRVSGLEVLAWIRNQPHLRRLPVILLTSSSQTADINRAYDLGANSFLVKPPDLDSLTQLVKTVAHYWVQTNVRRWPTRDGIFPGHFPLPWRSLIWPKGAIRSSAGDGGTVSSEKWSNRRMLAIPKIRDLVLRRSSHGLPRWPGG